MPLNLRPYGVYSQLLGQPWERPESWQWEPTLTAHDPNPPLILGETPVFTANAVIKATLARSFTADAYIAPLHFFADAVVRATFAASFTADAVLAWPYRFTVDSVFGAYYWQDNFNRVGSGLGTSSDGTVYVDNGSSVPGSTDGSVFTVPSPAEFTDYYGYRSPRRGIISLDILMPTDPTTDDPFIEIDVGDGAHYQALRIQSNGDGTWAFSIEGNASFAEVDPTVDPSEWYTVKAFYDLNNELLGRIKVWKRSDPEPDWQTESATLLGLINHAAPYEWTVSTDTEDLSFDNVSILATDPKVIQSATFTADSVLKRTVGDGTTTQPQYIGTTEAGTATTTVTATKPTGVVTGDSIFAFVSYAGSNGRPSDPTGWSKLLSLNNTGAPFDIWVRNATSTEPATYDWVQDNAFPMIVQLHAFRGYGSPSYALTIAGGSGTTHTAAAITTTLPGDILIHAFAGWLNFTSGLTWTGWPTAMNLMATTRQTQGITSMAVLSLYKQYDTPQAAGTKTATSSSFTNSEIVTIVLSRGGRFFTADAVLREANAVTNSGSFTADAYFSKTFAFSFTAGAVIVGIGRSRHDRTDLHRDTQDDLVVLLSAAVGGALQGDTLHEALVELEDRITTRENTGT